MRDEPPQRAWGLGGRQVRIDPMHGEIYDHHAVCYEYPDGAQVFAYCRQQPGCWGDVADVFLGTKGRADILKHEIKGESPWKFAGRGGDMYVLEHEALFRSIRDGQADQQRLYMARSTMMAILGRMVDYTGQTITWDEAMRSKQVLAPSGYSFDAQPPTKPGPDGRYPIAMPGVTKLV